MRNAVLRFSTRAEPGMRLASATRASPDLARLDPEEVVAALKEGKRLNVYSTLYGTATYNYVEEPREPDPKLMLVETYRLDSFLGAYGAGRVIETLTLLPGEKTRISVKSFTGTEMTRKEASSILDSFTQESADDFESTLQHEQSDKRGYAETFQYHAETEAKASWGFGSAKVSGGVKGGSNSARGCG
jgi:hypothetical protein